MYRQIRSSVSAYYEVCSCQITLIVEKWLCISKEIAGNTYIWVLSELKSQVSLNNRSEENLRKYLCLHRTRRKTRQKRETKQPDLREEHE